MRIFLLLSCLVCSSASAQEHLEPEPSIFLDGDFNEYHQIVIDAFGEVFERNVKAKLIAIPSFMPEYAIGIKDDSGTYKIFKLKPERSYWGFYLVNEDSSDLEDLAKEYPESYQDIKIDKCEHEISSELANSILAVWEVMLLGTRHRKTDEIGLDGAVYHFSMRSNFQQFSGQTWSPSPASLPGKLVSLSAVMGAWCESPAADNLAALEKAVSTLRAAL